jgi:hypothetical protein
MEAALFERVGEQFLPTKLSCGPWSAEALHGGPPAALLGRAIERFEAGAGGEEPFVARITLELLRPVPVALLDLRTRLVRPGRKVQLVEASLFAGDQEVARATALRIRRKDVHLPLDLPTDAPVLPAPPETGEPAHRSSKFLDGFHTHGVEHRFVRGQMSVAGPATDWIRLLAPLLAGEEPSPLCRVCVAADFGNGVSGVLPDTHTYINPDLTLYLHRYPRGEWVCLDAHTRVEAHGTGLAESRLFDREGPIGRAVQSLIIEER